MKNKKTYELTLGAMFTALMIVMAFTPLGYLRIGTLSISFMTIPVAIGAILLGPAWGTFFGLLFGVTSCISGIMTGEGAVMMSISLPLYIFVTIAPRILVGAGSGMVYKLLKNSNAEILPVIATSVSAPVLNTVLYLSALLGCYYNTDVVKGFMEIFPQAENVFMLAVLLAGVNAVVELVACAAVSVGLSTFIIKMLENKKH